ncbi:hypothetical protein Tco_0875549 [Tanacetum coccineum]|uniref:Uncharacterized protein n=1 Tax=Tanacetum coccineum TaxID=301880 RepID=A0ABQ5BSQ9_9ASTR
MCNATATPTLKPTEVTVGMGTSTVGPDVRKNNGTGLNLIDPSTSTTRLNSTISANLQKLKANVPNDADYDFWLSLASVHEVNERMKNSHGYLIGKRLPFPVWNGLCATIGKNTG